MTNSYTENSVLKKDEKKKNHKISIKNLFEFWESIGLSNGYLVSKKIILWFMKKNKFWPNRIFSYEVNLRNLNEVIDGVKNDFYPNLITIDKSLNHENLRHNLKSVLKRLKISEMSNVSYKNIEKVEDKEGVRTFLKDF